MMSDLPRFARLAEQGKLDLKSMVTSTWTLDQTRQALQVLSGRSEMYPVVVAGQISRRPNLDVR